MASNATTLRQAVTQAPARQEKKPTTIAGLLSDPAVKSQMALALPKHMTSDRLARIALTEVRKNPKLAECNQTSFLGAIMQCAALGLEPGGALGHCYLLPFENRRKNTVDVQFIIGYRGMIDLARRSGQIISLEARAVYEKDEFEVSLGLDSNIIHRPAWHEKDRGRLTFVYAVAKLQGGGVQFDVMSVAEVENIRDNSQGYKSAVSMAKRYNKEPSSPWIDHFEPMALKTVTRRLFKWLPVSIEMQRAVGMDEQAEAGQHQDNPLVIDADYRIDDGGSDEAPAETGHDRSPADSGITAQEVHDALIGARGRDDLDMAADLIRMLPETDRGPLNDLYQQRLSDIEA